VEFLFVRKFWAISYKVSVAWIKELFHYGKYVFSTSISVMVLYSINQMILGTIINPAAAGAFNVASRIWNLSEIPINAVCTMIFPQSAKRFANEGDGAAKYLYERSVGIILAILIPALVFLYLFPSWVVIMVAGSKYLDTIPLIRIVAVCCLIAPFNRMFGTILDSTGRPKLNFYIILSLMTTECIFTYALVKWFGLIGAMEATLIAMSIFFVIMQVILKNMFRVNFLNAFQYAVKFYSEMINSYVKPMLVK
jgi:O-antigen/teichoic acid export membrane protein